MRAVRMRDGRIPAASRQGSAGLGLPWGTIPANTLPAMSRPRLDPRQIAPDVAPLLLVALAELVAGLGVPPQRLCEGLGFDLDDLRAAQPISDRQAWRMIRRALQLSGRADLGLELGSRQSLGNFGLTGYAMSATRTLGEAIELGLQHQKQAGGLIDIAVERVDDRLFLVASQRLRDESVLPFLIEEIFSSLLLLVRTLVGPGFRLGMIEMTYPAPAHAARYHALFDCPVRFGARRNRMGLEAGWLAAPVLGHSPVMAVEMRRLLELREREQAAPVQSVTAAVQGVLERAPCPSQSIEQVARALQLSARTLRRRLREADTSFREISDRVRAQAARQLLREQGLTVAEASRQLGFSDARAFRRAYKRWLGQVPGDARLG